MECGFAPTAGMKQLNFLKQPKVIKEHGGSLSFGKRKSQRPLSIKKPLHLVLKSDLAFGNRSLLRHRPLIESIISKAKRRFNIRVYEVAVVSNHIHLLIKGFSRKDLQNFFRVVGGHIAQEILRKYPRLNSETACRGGARQNNENKFWVSRIYSRIVTWGSEYFTVKTYIFQNTLKALQLIAYKPRKKIKSSA